MVSSGQMPPTNILGMYAVSQLTPPVEYVKIEWLRWAIEYTKSSLKPPLYGEQVTLEQYYEWSEVLHLACKKYIKDQSK